MNKENIIQVTAFNPSTEENFRNLKKLQSSFGRIIGVNFKMPKNSRENLAWFLLSQSFICSFVIFLVAELLVAIYDDDDDQSFYLFAISSLPQLGVMSFYASAMFSKRVEIHDLFERCEIFYRVAKMSFNNEWKYKVIFTLHRMSFSVPIFLSLSSLIVSIVTQDILLIYPTYNMKYWNSHLIEACTVNMMYAVASLFANRAIYFILTLFTVITDHIQCEYKYLIVTAHKTGKGSNVSEILNQIIDQHSKTIQIIKDTDKIFYMPMFANEGFCMIGIPYVGFSLIYLENSVMLAFTMGFLVMFNLMYCIFGQQIIDSAAEFEASLYGLDWLSFNVDERRKLIFILRMAQKPIGVTSGGFHFLGHPQMTQVRL